ncbi:MAG: GntR family transcriptional regulator [Acidimicrobiia bacterium]|nr:GntR family transcriptional regulator [Acidimicrobiia bacterium]
MVRTIRYREIADTVRHRIDEGTYGPGQVLPSEAELTAEFGASRVTVRRALDSLRHERRIDSRQGFGWFVPADPLPQMLARLETLDAHLAASRRSSERQVTGFAFAPAPPRVASVLGVDTVLEVRRRHLADGRPFARITVWCPEALGASLSRAEVEESSFIDLLDVAWGGAVQTIGAQLAGDEDAELLAVPSGSPVLVCRRTTSDESDHPVLMSEHVFPGHLTEFVVELSVSSSIEPSGLRLVD